jgi:hypothetical protein
MRLLKRQRERRKEKNIGKDRKNPPLHKRKKRVHRATRMMKMTPMKRKDNLRGYDPASEDDMEDNGMSRYMENYDEEGWY